MEPDYYLITVKQQELGKHAQITKTTSFAIAEDPVDYVLDWNKTFPKEHTVLLYSKKITSAQYAAWEEVEPTIWE